MERAPVEEPLAARGRGRALAGLGHGDDRVQARRRRGSGAREDPLEGPLPADRVVRRPRPSRRSRRGGPGSSPTLEEIAQTAAASSGDQEDAVGEDRGRTLRAARRLEDREDLAVQKGLAAREVVLPHAQAAGLRRSRARRRGSACVAAVRGRARDEAVRARQVAEGARDLEPEGVEGERRDVRKGLDRHREANLRSQKEKGPSPGPLRIFEAEAQRLRSMSLTNSLRGRAPRARSATCAVLEEDEGRDRGDLVAHGDLRGLVDVDLGDLDLAGVLRSRGRPRSERRSGRAAPGRPEIDEDRDRDS